MTLIILSINTAAKHQSLGVLICNQSFFHVKPFAKPARDDLPTLPEDNLGQDQHLNFIMFKTIK